MTTRLALLTLPPEILENIASILYSDGNQIANGLKDLSGTCKLFREITAPILFHERTLAISSNLEPVQRLLADTDLQWMKYVHFLTLRSEAGFSVLTSGHIAGIYHELRRYFERLTGLRVLRIETCHTSPPLALGVLRERNLHVILNLQNGGIGFNVRQWESFLNLPNWRWSLFAPKYQFDLSASQEGQSLNLTALKRAVSSDLPAKDSWLQIAKHSPALEELHLIDKQVEIAIGETPALKPQIKTLLQHMPSLRRLRIEGSILAWHLIPQLPTLNNLRHLTIYSGWKIAFHRMCTDEVAIPVADVSWSTLPNLKYLDIRFICNHHSIQQIVPPGLLGLRIEFFGPKDHLSIPDLHWLQRACPDLERLELDIGSFLPESKDGRQMPQETANRLHALSGFRNLHVLRLFPTYWDDGKLLPHPLESNHWPVTLFAKLQKPIPLLRELHICMSYGEYPFDVVPRMFEGHRPLKFRVLRVNETEYTLQYSFAYSETATEAIFRGDLDSPVSERGVPVQLNEFFDDLDHDWVISHCDYVGNHQRMDEEEE